MGQVRVFLVLPMLVVLDVHPALPRPSPPVGSAEEVMVVSAGEAQLAFRPSSAAD